MKKTLLLFILLGGLLGVHLHAQTSCHWVFMTDKQGTTFNPYEYFDAQAIVRYKANGMNLNDASNYPVNAVYAQTVNNLATETVGQSRWMNAVAVMATPEQIARIEQLSFVARTQLIAEAPMQLASTGVCQTADKVTEVPAQHIFSDQLVRMQGELFAKAGFNGKGIRIAVFDGGFPRVNTHQAFQHLRDSNRIVDTWNFPNNKADVYGWNSHGLMTLSCIAGCIDHNQLGLATGAEYMLYRTEVELEPAREEVWWMMAVERADQHGANIISSSLGYGKERYYTRDMDGTSYVAKAANMAARRGILVVNSAGNEDDSRQWRTIITPSDADSALCVGGIEASLYRYKKISFSSCGPSADGRLKPEVCAFGHAQVASSKEDTETMMVDGTSFSCPLVAGFAACAWQASPGKTAMQMKEELERSADRYPYFDYALGYGVPQASYFVDKNRDHKAPTFVFEEDADSVSVRLIEQAPRAMLFYNKQLPDGSLVEYNSWEVLAAEQDGYLRFHKASLDSCTLNVSYDGYSASFRLNESDRQRFADVQRAFWPASHFPKGEVRAVTTDDGSPKRPQNWGTCAKWYGGLYWHGGSMICLGGDEQNIRFSPVNHIGFNLMRAFSKSYKVGLGIEWAMANYHLDRDQCNRLDELLGTLCDENVTKKYMKQGDWSLELFQRVRFAAGGLVGNGLYWDLGLYGALSYYNYHIKYDCSQNNLSHVELVEGRFNNPDYLDRYRLNWGVTTRFVFDEVGLYFRYRLTGIFSDHTLPEQPTASDFYFNLPRFEAGILLSF